MAAGFHLDEDCLLEYGAGSLDEAWGLAIATHLSFCPSCRSRTMEFEALGGVTLDELPASLINDDALAVCLKRLDEETPETEQNCLPETSVLPSVLHHYTGGNLEKVQWRRVGGGVRQAVIPTEGKAVARLLRIPAGVAVPDHGHGGKELTVVLSGCYADGDRLFQRGDIQEVDGSVEHSPNVVGTEECLCLVATDAPLKFKSFLPRVAQRFARL